MDCFIAIPSFASRDDASSRLKGGSELEMNPGALRTLSDVQPEQQSLGSLEPETDADALVQMVEFEFVTL